MSATIIPEADPETVLEAENNQKERDLRYLAAKTLEEAEIKEEYDIGYRRDNQESERHQGTFYNPAEISSYYNGDEPDIHVAIETGIEEFYASLNGDFRIVDEEGEVRKYKLIMSCDEGMLFKGEIDYGDREVTDFRYKKGGKRGQNKLQAYIDGGWRTYGRADEIGDGNKTMTQIEFLDSAFRQLKDDNSAGENKWEIIYSQNLNEELEELPPQVKSTLDNKTSAFEQNLALGLSPENIFKVMSPPWKPLLEMNLGENYRAMFVKTSNLPKNATKREFEADRELIGLCARPKNELHDNFRINPGRNDSDSIRTNGINFALNLLRNE